jgi:hypothetical protein
VAAVNEAGSALAEEGKAEDSSSELAAVTQNGRGRNAEARKPRDKLAVMMLLFMYFRMCIMCVYPRRQRGDMEVKHSNLPEFNDENPVYYYNYFEVTFLHDCLSLEG